MNVYNNKERKEFYLTSLLYDAIEFRHFGSIKSLLEKGANPNLVLPTKGISPFHLTIGCDSASFAKEVSILILQNKGDPNVRSDDGLTPVHIAAAWGRYQILQLLLHCGGDPLLRDANHKTPMYYAHEGEFTDCLQLLRSYYPPSIFSEAEEKDDAYSLALDKILVEGGEMVTEFNLVNESPKNSIKHSNTNNSLSNLNSLPQADMTEYIINWFEKQPRLSVNVSKINNDSLNNDILQAESSPDESDITNPNEKRTSLRYITFRKVYRKTRSKSKSPQSKSQKSISEKTVYSDAKSALDFTENNEAAEDFTHCKNFSKESGIVTLPVSEEDSVINENEKKHENCLFEISAKGAQSERLVSKQISLDKEDKSSDYLTCSHSSISPFEMNIIDLTEDLSTNLSVKCDNTEADKRKSEVSSAASNELSFVSVSEVYKYVDKEQDIVLYERRLMKAASECTESLRSLSLSSSVPSNVDYDTDTIRRELTLLGFNPGPITVSTKRVYVKKLHQLRKYPVQKEIQQDISAKRVDLGRSQYTSHMDYDNETVRRELIFLGYNPGPITFSTKRVYLKKLHQPWRYSIQREIQQYIFAKRVYSLELEKTLRNTDWCQNIAVYKTLEEVLVKEFQHPDSTKRWREGVCKASFTYLLLDPRRTYNLPCRAENLQPKEVWETFLSAIFYVGKGKRARPYQHLYEAADSWKKDIANSNSKKIQKIFDIWKTGCGVICLHVFLNVIPAEAYTREAAMISALKLENLTNIKGGEFYGVPATWNQRQKKMLGVYLLYKAMMIFLNEGERQLCPEDIG